MSIIKDLTNATVVPYPANNAMHQTRRQYIQAAPSSPCGLVMASVRSKYNDNRGDERGKRRLASPGCGKASAAAASGLRTPALPMGLS